MPRATGDPGTTRQLDAAITALRTIISIVPSADALAHLSDEVRLLSLRVERLKNADGSEAALNQSAAARGNVKAIRCGERPGKAFEARPLLLVSSTAAILVAVFIGGMTMLQAVQPRVHVPATSRSHKIAARRAPSFLISPVPIEAQSFDSAARDHTREASASLDGFDQRREFRAPGR